MPCLIKLSVDCSLDGFILSFLLLSYRNPNPRHRAPACALHIESCPSSTSVLHCIVITIRYNPSCKAFLHHKAHLPCEMLFWWYTTAQSNQSNCCTALQHNTTNTLLLDQPYGCKADATLGLSPQCSCSLDLNFLRLSCARDRCNLSNT